MANNKQENNKNTKKKNTSGNNNTNGVTETKKTVSKSKKNTLNNKKNTLNNKKNTIKKEVIKKEEVNSKNKTSNILNSNYNFIFNKKYQIIFVSSLITILILSLIFSITYNSRHKEVKIETKTITKYQNDENIVFYGDSITSKYEIEHFFPNNKIINSGKSGDKSSDLLERLEDDVYKYNPSKVFILIGINDLNHKVDKDDILNNIQEIITKIKVNRKYAKLYIESVYPINQDFLKESRRGFNNDLTNDDIIEFNKEIKKIADNNNITYINVYNTLTDEDGNLKREYSKEGLHLNNIGYLNVSKVLEKYIKEK